MFELSRAFELAPHGTKYCCVANDKVLAEAHDKMLYSVPQLNTNKPSSAKYIGHNTAPTYL